MAEKHTRKRDTTIAACGGNMKEFIVALISGNGFLPHPPGYF